MDTMLRIAGAPPIPAVPVPVPVPHSREVIPCLMIDGFEFQREVDDKGRIRWVMDLPMGKAFGAYRYQAVRVPEEGAASAYWQAIAYGPRGKSRVLTMTHGTELAKVLADQLRQWASEKKSNLQACDIRDDPGADPPMQMLTGFANLARRRFDPFKPKKEPTGRLARHPQAGKSGWAQRGLAL